MFITTGGFSFSIPSEKERATIRESYEYRRTISSWTRHNLSARSKVGSLLTLISKVKPKTFSEWEKAYVKFYTEEFPGQIMFNQACIVLSKTCRLTVEEAFVYAYIRVIDETWIGYQREKKAFSKMVCFANKLKTQGVNGVYFSKSDEYIDTKYAVDVEQYKNGRLVAGFQLKSRKYGESIKTTSDVNISSKYRISIEKQKDYERKFGVPVFWVHYEDLEEENECAFDALIHFMKEEGEKDEFN